MKNYLPNLLVKKGSKLVFWFVFAMITCSGLVTLAQSRTVSGTVVSANDNATVPGVSIRLKGSSKGTTSSADGKFSIQVGDNAILQFSMIGFAAKEVSVGTQSTINVALITDEKQLQEVVVTALGIKKDVRKIGVAIQTVDGSSLVKSREPNAINALAGKVAGLTIGAQPELLRKPNISLRGNSTVLYVVDGVPINSDTWNISPDDIETLSLIHI